MAKNNTLYTVRLVVHGDMGHGSRPENITRHAIYSAFDVVKSIKDILPPDAPLQVKSISTGGKNASNQFPPSCSVDLVISNVDATLSQKLDTHISTLSYVDRI